MDVAGLIVATGLMGLAGTPHCAAMCAAPCAAVTRSCGPSVTIQPAFHAGRLLGYAAAGAAAAYSMTAMQHWLSAVPALRPLWTLLHVAALALGMWMLASGRLPAFGAARAPAQAPPLGWQRIRGPLRSAAAGTAWIAWPCALSQSALLVAALADRPWNGAAAMAAFGLASSAGLVIGPLMLRRLGGRAQAGAVVAVTWPVRLAGLALSAGSAWALGHGLWQRVAAWCAG